MTCGTTEPPPVALPSAGVRLSACRTITTDLLAGARCGQAQVRASLAGAAGRPG
jgi:hypothetical protein